MTSVPTKTCSKCGETKTLDGFYFRPDGKPRGAQCRACNAAKVSEWAKANPEKVRRNSRNWARANPERAKNWAAANRERSREIKTAWRLRNPDQMKRIRQDHYIKNADAVKQYAKSWREANPERWATVLKLNARKREARRRSNPTFHVTAKDAQRILRSPCAVTGCEATDIQFDHVIPICRGGSHGIGNLQPLCGSHNASKNDKTWMEFRVYLRRAATVARTA